jgi:hypothetical protein
MYSKSNKIRLPASCEGGIPARQEPAKAGIKGALQKKSPIVVRS